MSKDEQEYYKFLSYLRKTVMLESRRIKEKLSLEQRELQSGNAIFSSVIDIKKNTEENVTDNQLLTSLISNLNQLQREVIIKHYYQCKTVKEIANELNTSRQNINQIKVRAIQKLKESYYE